MARPISQSLMLLPLAWVLACAEDQVEDIGPGPGPDAALDGGLLDGSPRDGSLGDQGFPDATPDAAVGDTGVSDLGFDVGPSDATPADLGADDSGAGDSGVPDASDAGSLVCDYLDLEIRIVSCPGGIYQYLRGFEDLNQNAACAPYWELDGVRYADAASAISGQGCDPNCVYQASTSVSLVDRCGHRNGYIVYTAAACPDLYEFSDGLFPSVEAWEAQLNCGG